MFIARRYWNNYRLGFYENIVLFYVLGAAFLLFFAHFAFGPTLHKVYFLYVAPFALVFVAGICVLWQNFLQERGVGDMAPGTLQSFLVPLIVVTIVLQSVSLGIASNNTHDIIFFNRFDYRDADINRIKYAGEYLATLTTKEDLILSIDNPYHVLESGRFLFPPLISPVYEFNDMKDQELLRRYARYNTAMFFEWFENSATVVVFQPGLTY